MATVFTSWPLRRRRGAAIVYIVVMMVVFMGLISLSVDVGNVQVTKSQLQNAAEAAARAGAFNLSNGTSAAKSAAVTAAAANTANGTSVSLNSNTDVIVGTYSNGTFTSGGSSPNAVEVFARRTTATNNAVPLFFASIIGQSTCNITVSAIAAATNTGGYGLAGLQSITMSGNGYTDSYNAAAGAYSAGSAGNAGNVAGNGNITMSGNAVVNGNASPGIGDSVSTSENANVTGSTSPLTYTLSYPNASLPSSYTSEGSLSVSGNSSTTIPAGTYYYTGFSISGNGTVNVTGQVNIYVSGSVTLSGNASIYQNLPANFNIYVIGSGSVSISGNGSLYANVYAPQSAVSLRGNGTFYGALIGETLTLSGNGGIHYDTSLGYSGGSTVSLVQ